MSESKIIKIRWLHHGVWKEEDYESDGYDQINGVLEHLANRFVPASSIPTGLAIRPPLPKRDLTKQGISVVEVKFEDSDWLELHPNDLIKI